ncbi:MAG TPA: DUF4252 domain-containing protein [Opitutaceae bacterium]|nr:DUF4252 domain-containing protein [Opitutaceae bacterium]HRJ46285.1 DUF4252 domain-containing protein [Opitutaceae bacterium]
MFQPSLFAAALALGAPALTHAGTDAVDFGSFPSAAGCEYVEINLRGGLIRFAAKLAATQEPEAAELLRNIKHVRVNVVGMGQSNRDATLARVTGIRADLEKRGWEKIVTVQESGAEGDDVAIYLKSKDEDSIEGLVVTVIEKRGKVVLVNVVGHIEAGQIAKLGEKLNVEPLRKIKVSAQPGV